MLKRYKTVRDTGETEIIIQKSRFIAYVSPASNEEEAVRFINSVKKKHWDATHNCSAYITGENNEHQKANDDGEPGGTAGKPMLEVLKKNGLKNTVVVVTRYFGGIKLGAGGLIRAYSQSTAEGLNAAGIVIKELHRRMDITIDYSMLGKLENELRSQHFVTGSIEYLDQVTIPVFVPADDEEQFTRRITDLTGGRAEITGKELRYLDKEMPES